MSVFGVGWGGGGLMMALLVVNRSEQTGGRGIRSTRPSMRIQAATTGSGAPDNWRRCVVSSRLTFLCAKCMACVYESVHHD